MATSTTETKTTTSTTAAPETEENEPKHCLEHSVSDSAICKQAACKRAGTKIRKGELRLGVLSWYEPEQKFIRLWRHWACTTKRQIKTIKELAGDDVTNVAGYNSLSPESQEQVRLAFEEGTVVDKEFKDIRIDLAKRSGGEGEIRNAVGYKVDVAARRSGCRSVGCTAEGGNIVKGELRLGIATVFMEEHTSWVYKHWRCVSKFDLQGAREYYEQDDLEGIGSLPEEYRTAIIQSLEKNEVIDPPMLEPAPAKKAKKSRKKAVDTDTDDDEPKPAKKTRKPRKKKVEVESDESEEILPKKTRGKKRVVDEAEADEEAGDKADTPRPKRKTRSG
ncbi:zf-PARP-domain-containing protein [Periconia macrospinosa]|uniref:Zf-PARP-domain-containing protein n=1 Tax=Periconia macrospinosa TaxID=97972 RepID=A0A2V1E5L5_9PLEO|nr:zf-PARP-domain-containing protein [Periconia macrospinosa]